MRDPAVLLTAPLTVTFRARSFAMRRGVALLGTAALHLALIAALALGDLFLVGTMKPPRAATSAPLHFYRPGPPPGGGGGGHPPKPPAPDAPQLQPPAPKPVVFALPPPEERAVPSPDDAATASNRTGDALGEGLPSGPPGDGTGVGSGTGPGPGGDGVGGDGVGGDGVGGDGTGGPGFGPGDEPPYPEGHPDIVPPVLIASSRAYPRYPDLARKAGVQGTVILLVVIDIEGRVGSIDVLRSPDPRYGFELATIEAIKQWRYRPALLGGRPVAVQASITFEFTLSR